MRDSKHEKPLQCVQACDIIVVWPIVAWVQTHDDLRQDMKYMSKPELHVQSMHIHCSDGDSDSDSDKSSERGSIHWLSRPVTASRQGDDTHPCFKLLALVVNLPQASQVGLGLVLEEGVVQHLVVDVQLAHLGLHAVPLLLLQLLVLLLLLQGKIGMISPSASASCSLPFPAWQTGHDQ